MIMTDAWVVEVRRRRVGGDAWVYLWSTGTDDGVAYGFPGASGECGARRWEEYHPPVASLASWAEPVGGWEYSEPGTPAIFGQGEQVAVARIADPIAGVYDRLEQADAERKAAAEPARQAAADAQVARSMLRATVKRCIRQWAWHHRDHIGNCAAKEYAWWVVEDALQQMLASGLPSASLPGGHLGGLEGAAVFVPSGRYLEWSAFDDETVVRTLHRARAVIHRAEVLRGPVGWR